MTKDVGGRLTYGQLAVAIHGAGIPPKANALSADQDQDQEQKAVDLGYRLLRAVTRGKAASMKKPWLGLASWPGPFAWSG